MIYCRVALFTINSVNQMIGGCDIVHCWVWNKSKKRVPTWRDC